MSKLHTSIRLDSELVSIIDKVVSKKKPKSDRTRYLEEAAWEKLEGDQDAKDMLSE